MGRPIKASYFGAPKGTGVGGESVSSVGSITAGKGYFSANATSTFGAPNVTGGIQALGTPVLNAQGNVTAVTITVAGSGYTSVPTVIFAGANATPAFGTVALTAISATANAMVASAFVSTADGGSSAVAGDIIKQVASKRYKVQTVQGSGKVSLVVGAPAAGQMRITAYDSAAGTYYVKKLYGRTAVLSATGTGTQFTTDQQVPWTFGTPVISVSVQIENR